MRKMLKYWSFKNGNIRKKRIISGLILGNSDIEKRIIRKMRNIMIIESPKA